MSQRPITQLLFASGFTLLLLHANAVPAAPSLSMAVDAAYELSQQAPRANALQRESAAIRSQASSLLAADPALDLYHLNDRFNTDAGREEWDLGMEIPLWLPGQRDARHQVANSVERQADDLVALLRWEIAGQVRTTAWQAAIAEGRLRQAELALQSAKALELNVRKRTQAGELARMDLLLAQKESLDAESVLQSARAEQQQAMHRWQLLTGFNELPHPLDEALLKESDDIAAHPRLLAADGSMQRARAERDRALSERRDNPLLTLGGKRERDARGQDYANALTLEVRVAFGLASQSAPRIAGAERELTERQSELLRIGRELEADRIQARMARDAAGQAVAMAERQQTLAAEALRLAHRSFELGESDLPQLLRVRQQSLEADLNLELQRLARQRAVALLNQALGLPPK